MPLIEKKSKKAFSQNVSTEMHAGKPQKQALAIAYHVKRKAKKASGGTVKSGSHDMDMAHGGYAEGGEITAKSERRPMPDNIYNDSKNVSQNSGDKALSEDSWTDRPDIRQSQKGPKTTRIKHPKMVPQDGYSVRMRDEEDDLQQSAKPNEGPQEQPPKHDDEEGPDRQGPPVRDMEDEHSTHRKPYAKGGEVEESDYSAKPNKYMDDLRDLPPSHDEGDEMAMSHNEEGPDRQGHEVRDMEAPHNKYQRSAYAQGGEISIHHDMDEQPMDEEEKMHEASIAAAIMSKRKKMHQDSDSDIDHEMYMADGGEILRESEEGRILSHHSIDSDDSDQADLSRNADEDANEEDHASHESLMKENYSETPGLDALDSPMDSAQTNDPREDREENIHDRSIVSRIRSKMKQRSPITR